MSERSEIRRTVAFIHMLDDSAETRLTPYADSCILSYGRQGAPVAWIEPAGYPSLRRGRPSAGLRNGVAGPRSAIWTWLERGCGSSWSSGGVAGKRDAR